MAHARFLEKAQIPLRHSQREPWRRLVGAIEECDAELTRLRQISAPSEIDRLSAQLSTFEQSPGEEARQLAALVRRQLDVVRSVGLQCEVLVHRRTHLFELLRGIWLHLSALADDGDGSVAGRLATLCATVESALHVRPAKQSKDS